ncbi:hypothetical protein BDY17DRAFT_312432 [Neohortaea acidophila]|uniref:BZIP domain-containing protein n=1 Tax=Neohortaea acidophila TaxID=245834 RepID=A0A6A6PKL6_9PEZI|nr:uncharacterized protein BDY17DRAFT_312432 [Neohortaea acidophila]KAF2480552.1 hypothetical protein BDY17DRAFT_312432 [Neohortaea acidophila]
MSQGESGTPRAAASTDEDDWSSVKDPNERRKIQNRLAQRKFREKTRQQREDAERDAANQQHAASAYTPPSPQDLVRSTSNEEGLPWGSIPLGHAMATSKQKEQSSGESSVTLAETSKAGASSSTGSDSFSWSTTPEAVLPGLLGGHSSRPTFSPVLSQELMAYDTDNGQLERDPCDVEMESAAGQLWFEDAWDVM